MSFVAVVGGAIDGITGIVSAISGKRRKKKSAEEEARKQEQLEASKEAYAAMDTSNPFENMQNQMEDLKVSTQEAEFAQQMAQQNQANLLQGMRGAAGGSGIAALAQTMASQGALAAQQSAISIGKQEAANQSAKAAEAANIQQLERTGIQTKQQADKEKVATLMGLDAADVQAAAAAEEAANAQMWSSIGGAAQGFGQMAGGISSQMQGSDGISDAAKKMGSMGQINK